MWETPWPDADLSLLEQDEVEIVVQVNGKLRDRVAAPTTATREELEALAREQPNVLAHIDGKQIVKVDRRAVEARELRRALTPRRVSRAARRGFCAPRVFSQFRASFGAKHVLIRCSFPT